MASSTRGRRAHTRAPFIVAIDGPAGAGKSTVAKGVARELGFAHLDTGSMYRAVTAKALEEGIDPEDGKALAALARRMDISFTPTGLLVDGRKAGRELRTRRVNQAVSAVSAHGGVREELARIQRSVPASGPVVAEGRDTGTVVFPDAPVKIFLTASIAERARRRHKEISTPESPVALSTLKEEIARRDNLDSSRAISPLVPAPDAVIMDTTEKSPQRVIADVVALVRKRLPTEARPR